MSGAPASVRLVASAPHWPEAYATLCVELLAVFGTGEIAIEHIGSTAVPGLLAKPVLDLMLGAPTLAAIEARIPALTAIGYQYVDRHEHELPQRRYFARQPAGTERIHLHGLVRGDRLWREHLAFRDALRANAELRARYAALKAELVARGLDKAAYTAAKAPFIRTVLDACAAD